MTFSYRGTIFDKRGCYVILPAPPAFWRQDSSDNNADEDDDVEVLEGPEVEIRDSCETDEEGEKAIDMEVCVEAPKNEEDEEDESHHYQMKQSLTKSKGLLLPGNRQSSAADPDNRYYEVEAIMDGPKKRREHLFKMCYKVRWKGYGSDADTWQPLADLVNVQDMIEEFRRAKVRQKHVEKEKRAEKRKWKASTVKAPKKRSLSPQQSEQLEPVESKKWYDPVYGTVKDKFWKDLELGRHQNSDPLFSGDMYSKVKGCRRAAHTDALANIRKQQGESPSDEELPSPVLPTEQSYDDNERFSRSPSPISLKHRESHSPSRSPKGSSAEKGRKHSAESFSTRDASRKRLRKSRDRKSYLVSSVTSETVGIMTTSTPVITPPVQAAMSTVSLLSLPTPASQNIAVANLATSLSSRSSPYEMLAASPATAENSDSDDEAGDQTPDAGRMTVSSETMLTVTTECRRLGVGSRLVNSDPGHGQSQTSQLGSPTDVDFWKSTPSLNVGASGDESLAGPSCENGGATSGGTPPGKTSLALGCPMHCQSEATGAVNRSQDANCLWNGACNRSDCKSNRRRNMKNGRKNAGRAATPSGSNDSPVVVVDDDTPEEYMIIEDDSEHSAAESENPQQDAEGCQTDEDVEEVLEENIPEHHRLKAAETGRKKMSNLPSASAAGNDSSQPYTSHEPTSSFKKDNLSTSQSGGVKSGRQPEAQTVPSSKFRSSWKPLIPSPFADSSDSSFDEGSSMTQTLSKEALSSSFLSMNSAMPDSRPTSSTSSSSNNTDQESVTSGSCALSKNSPDIRKINDMERPGLFSGSNSFLFMQKESKIAERSSQSLSTTGSSFRQSQSPPGKENCTSSKVVPKQQVTRGSDVSDVHSGSLTSSMVQSLSSHLKTFSERSDSLSARKRNDLAQPLDKIASPNSRDIELDQRIVTLTCDDLEDFVEQGTEHYSKKDVLFISNADLLQAVNLNKAEVVKQAIKQLKSGQHKLDFEQPDISGLTLLMRAVQRGTAAIVEMLLEHGVNVNAQQTNGTSALMIAAEQNSSCLVAMLLKYGASSSLYMVTSDQAETALMKAIKKQSRDVVNLMLRVGVNTAPPTCSSLSALELAVERRNPHIEGIVRYHCQRLDQAFRSRVLATLDGTANVMEPLFPLQCFPLRESNQFTVKFNCSVHHVTPGEGFLLFIAHTKITEKGVKCRFHGGCPISSVTLNGIVQSPLTKEVNFVTSCHPIIQGCNTLVIHKIADYTSKAKLVVQAFRAKLL